MVRRGIGSDSTCRLCGHDLEELLHVLRDCPVARDIEWPCHFGMLAWRLWKNRNNFVFQDITWSTEEIIKVSYSWVHLDIDGLVKIEDDFAVVGGLVQHCNGKWIFDFYKYLGCCSVLESKLWSILDGLNLALDRGFQCILIQMDSREAIKSI
ncbi:hypothetical protein Gohar_010197 [Gossypium harknessii]|uniref:RNase H type-1 domain-containing protein n=1 Tax=Gossypium harknessii TaxID=34285 RepID=A0A7J9GQU3_9ROSI|nr:hypothetical protein [Gossypium harknessii]